MQGSLIQRGKRLLLHRTTCVFSPPRAVHANVWVLARRASYAAIPARSIILSGIQPTGIPHIGNYFGALYHWVQLQNEAAGSTKLIYQIADLHAMTKPYDPEQLPKWKIQTLVALLAIGLDPRKCTIFFQSMVCSKLICHGLLALPALASDLSRFRHMLN